ncbi:MAG TPA: ATP phosphoribosyltransferase regulatory subunit, partial [Pyrinomonadaceae bacterium]|nr:ATP phosphoribosyltransferase regulatory subunit [Pyrinomonadaceae bacterium]
MPSPKTQPARGMRDFLPADVRKREYVIGVIKSVYERYGFEPLETPAVENIETLMGKYGEEGNQLIFKILKRGEHEKTGEADLALRYDLTVPLARVVAQYQNELPKFFKRYQIQPVWRADRPARGRFREFYQCDVDVLGSKSMVVEAELCAAVSDVLEHLGFKEFTIHLNHRRLLDAMMRNAMIEQEKTASVLVVIDKLDKIGKEGVKSELAKLGLAGSNIDTILHLMTDQDIDHPA